MKAYLLIEGNTDLALFERLLPSQIRPEVSIIPVGGRSDISSKARSLLVTKRRPLALVTDADTSERDAVERRRETLEELVGAAAVGVSYKIILAVPEIESWYFEIPKALERLSGRKISLEQRELGMLQPKKVLQRLFQGHQASVVGQLANGLTNGEVEKLRETQPGKDLIQFLTEQVRNKLEPYLS